jgi:hypothetical protein
MTIVPSLTPELIDYISQLHDQITAMQNGPIGQDTFDAIQCAPAMLAKMVTTTTVTADTRLETASPVEVFAPTAQREIPLRALQHNKQRIGMYVLGDDM